MVVDQTKKKMEAALEHLKQELKALRTGRANPGMVESVVVEVYGTQMRLPELASIMAPEPRQLLITPFDKSNAAAIAKAIQAANLNLQAAVDGAVVRVKVPEMDGTVRKKMVEKAHELREKGKVAVRKCRQQANDELKALKSQGESEDALKKQEKTIQELTDKYCKQADEVTAAKEKEIHTI